MSTEDESGIPLKKSITVNAAGPMMRKLTAHDDGGFPGWPVGGGDWIHIHEVEGEILLTSGSFIQTARPVANLDQISADGDLSRAPVVNVCDVLSCEIAALFDRAHRGLPLTHHPRASGSIARRVMSKRAIYWILGIAGVASIAAFFAQQYALDRYDLNLPIPEWLWVQLATGWLFLIAGLVTARSPSVGPMGKWMVALALVWIARLVFTPPLIQWETAGMAFAFFGLLFVILFAYPDGRLSGWERWAAGIYLGAVAIIALVDLSFDDYFFWVRDDHPTCCPSHLLLIEHNPDLRHAILSVAAIGAAVVFLAIVIRFTVKWKASSGVGRRGQGWLALLLPVMVLLVLLPGLSVLGAGFDQAPFADPVSSRPALYISNGVLIIFAGIMVASLLDARLSRARVADLMDGLGGTVSPEVLELRIRDVLGDPGAQLAFSLAGSDQNVDIEGRTLNVDNSDSVQMTDLDGGVSLLHDSAADPGLVKATAAAAGLALENARLQAELKAQIQEVVESRRRLVKATDDARQAVERDLHDGAQQRLVSLASMLRQALGEGSQLAPELEVVLNEAATEADRAIADLRNLARGVHPAILTQAGLGPAIDTLTDRSLIPVRTSVTGQRFDEEIETSTYFVVAEALANANKHSNASRVEISVKADRGELIALVSDDGGGGAYPDGGGLRGLRDRVAALGGSLEVVSPPGEGTRLLATIPLGDGSDPA